MSSPEHFPAIDPALNNNNNHFEHPHHAIMDHDMFHDDSALDDLNDYDDEVIQMHVRELLMRDDEEDEDYWDDEGEDEEITLLELVLAPFFLIAFIGVIIMIFAMVASLLGF